MAMITDLFAISVVYKKEEPTSASLLYGIL